MTKLSIIAKEIQAQHSGPDITLPPIVIDSRKIQGGELFVALKGENHDGHDFILQAIEKGAKAVLAATECPAGLAQNISYLKVDNTEHALGKIAAHYRSQFSLPMVGLTGSCGKTTVKGMIESICQEEGKTLATKGNFNNHIGLPLTLMRLDSSYQFAVIEMGANHQGEIGYLGKIAKPNISLITNVAPAHLQGFGSVEGVAKAKGEIYEILPPNGIAILNIDQPFCELWRDIIKSRPILTFGLKPEADIHASEIALHPFSVEFTLHVPHTEVRVKMAIPGKHTVMNALAAAAAGFALQIPLEKIVAGLTSFQGVPGRLRRFKGLKDAWVIDDSYNANPGSMSAALDVLSGCSGKRIFVMGDMAELGDDSMAYHTHIGKYARQKGIEALLAVGKFSQHAVEAFGDGAKIYASKEALVADLKGSLNAQTIVLVKGSRSAGMEIVTEALTLREEVK